MKKYHNMVVDVCDWKVRGYFPMETFDHAAQIIFFQWRLSITLPR
jgi:hypothetical protein